jgi:hypothetical protein
MCGTVLPVGRYGHVLKRLSRCSERRRPRRGNSHFFVPRSGGHGTVMTANVVVIMRIAQMDG